MENRSSTSERAELLVRLTASPALLAAVLGLLWWHDRVGSSAPTDVAMALLACVGAYEVATMLGRAGRPVLVPVAVVCAAALAGLGLMFPDDPGSRGAARALLLAAAVLAAFLTLMRAPRELDVERLVGTLFPIVYVGLLLGLLRELGDGEAGARRLAFVVVASKASDIGGWLVGKTVGRHRMAPSVSPGKTWEGTGGGLLLSAAAAVAVLAVVGPLPGLASRPATAAAFGVMLGVASVVAGLTNSALKRRCGVKHSSSMLPGVGGVLDVIDSLLLAAPAAWVWYLVGGVG